MTSSKRTLLFETAYLSITLAAITLATTALLLTGCGMQGGTSTSSLSPIVPVVPASGSGTLSGHVHGGQQPVAGAIIQLYQVGATGYTSHATPLILASAQTGGVGPVMVTAGGSGYSSAPTVIFSGGSGSGAVASATVSGGAVTAITVTTAGTGYTYNSPPTISFSGGGGGSGATAVTEVVGNNSALTSATGSFYLTGPISCTPGTYLYLTASGGNPGLSVGTNNSAIAMMTALGPCNTLSSITFVQINEATTVAGAYALAQFSGGTTWGTAQSTTPTGNPADNFATSSSTQGSQGVANAMATANVLTSFVTGASPGGNTSGTAKPDYWQVNMIADILADCVNSSGPSSTACSTLFADVDGSTPGDTLQAAVDMALYPNLGSTKITALYNLIPPSGIPFNPYPDLATQVQDLTIGITYYPVVPGTTTALTTDRVESIVIDEYGNPWIGTETGTPSATATYINAGVLELDPTGNPIPNISGGGTSLTDYLINQFTLISPLTPTGSQYIGGEFSTTTEYGTWQGAFDTNNNYWFYDGDSGNAFTNSGGTGYNGTSGSRGNLVGITGSGAAFTSNGYTTTITNGGNSSAIGYRVANSARGAGMTIDGNNNIWMATDGGAGTTACPTTAPNLATVTYGGLYGVLNAGNPGTGSSAAGPSADAGTTASPYVVYGGTTTQNPWVLTIDPIVKNGSTYLTDTISSGTSTIAGAPFLWVLSAPGIENQSTTQGATDSTNLTGKQQGVINQFYTTTTGSAGTATNIGCYTSITQATTDTVSSVNGISSAEGGYVPVVTVAAPSSGTTATASAVVNSSGQLSITVVNGGTGYSSGAPPTVTFSTTSPLVFYGSNNATGYSATAIVNGSGVVTGFNVTQGSNAVGQANVAIPGTLTSEGASGGSNFNIIGTAPATDYYNFFMSSPTSMIFDGSGNLWVSNGSNGLNGTTDSTSSLGNPALTVAAAGSINASVSELTLNYGSSTFSAANTSGTYNLFHGLGGMADGSGSGFARPQRFAVDGAGNVFFTMWNAGGSGTEDGSTGIGEISGTCPYTSSNSNGATASTCALSPSTAASGWSGISGFAGSCYWQSTTVNGSGTSCSGTATTGQASPYHRYTTLSGASNPAVDLSGNVWYGGKSDNSTGTTPLTGGAGVSVPIVEIVGVAAPVVTPIAAALKAGTYGTKP